VINVTSVRPLNNNIQEFFPKPKQLKGGEQLYNGRHCRQEILTGLMLLKAEIAATKPRVIIALGDTALWALTGESGIGNWRGSFLQHESGATIIPTYHPAAILRMWEWRYICVNDLKKVNDILMRKVTGAPREFFLTSPSWGNLTSLFKNLHLRLDSGETLTLAVDIETRNRQIDCLGFAWSPSNAICIPFFALSTGESYWDLDGELKIVEMLRTLLLHPNVKVVGQNFSYDAAYMAKLWGWYPTPAFDTMIAHAVAFPGLPKALDFLSSLYRPWHRFWKNERKEADDKVDDQIRWTYNCRDCVATWECVPGIQSAIDEGNLQEPLDFEHSLFNPLMEMEMRGVRIDVPQRSEFSLMLMDERAKLEQFFIDISQNVWDDVPLTKGKTKTAWYNSPKQTQKVIFEVLGQPLVKNRKTGAPSVDDEALTKIMSREPLLIPLCEAMLTYRSLGVYQSTFVNSRLDHDNRIRTSYNPVGTETFRFNSTIDAFGVGMNLQNIPSGDKE